MTALEKFLKQIVLKQVEGSVYLLPAICDFQIEVALEEERNQGRSEQLKCLCEKPKVVKEFMEEPLTTAYEVI